MNLDSLRSLRGKILREYKNSVEKYNGCRIKRKPTLYL